MRTCAALLTLAVLGLLGPGLTPTVRANQDKDKNAAKVAEQKKAAEAAWEAVEAGPVASLETKHLLIYAPKAMEGKLKAVGTLLEKYYDTAAGAVTLNPEKDVPDGKVTVYLFNDRDLVPTFARRIEKRRPESGETGSFAAADDKMLAVGAPVAGKPPVSAETRAGEQVAALLLARKAGVRTPVPAWLLAGFGRATTYQVAPRDPLTLAERKQARGLARVRKPSDLWSGTVEPEEADALYGSVASFLAYGSGSKYFPKFLAGFAPEEGVATKTPEQALNAAGLKPDVVDRTWKVWAAR